MLDLPRLENESYTHLFREAQEIVKGKQTLNKPSYPSPTLHVNWKKELTFDLKRLFLCLYYSKGTHFSPELDLQIELDRLAIQNFINEKIASSKSDLGTAQNSTQNLADAIKHGFNHHASATENYEPKKNLTKSLSMEAKQQEDDNSFNLLMNQHNTFISRQSTKFTDSNRSFSKRKLK